MTAAAIGVVANSLKVGAPVGLFRTRIVASGADFGARQYDISRDGRFLINTLPDDAGSSAITLIQNWNPEAAARN
jgi:hypothetical protein